MADEFKSHVGEIVSQTMAREWIDKYDRERRTDKVTDTKSVFYGRDVLLKILSRDGCAGISFFYALKPNENNKDTLNLVLVGTREDGTLMWSEDGKGGQYYAFEFGTPCPPYCAI